MLPFEHFGRPRPQVARRLAFCKIRHRVSETVERLRSAFELALSKLALTRMRIDLGLSQDMGQTRRHTRITANNFSPSWRNLFGVISPFLNCSSSPRRQAAQQYGLRVWPIKGDRERAQGVSEQIVPVFMVHPHAGLLSVVSEARC